MPDQIRSISDLMEFIKITGFTESEHGHVRAWFRGHGDASWRLEPGVCRGAFAKTEEKRKEKERHLTQDFQALAASFLRDTKSDAEIYFLQQHYRMPTRLLDWSLNPLAALFFALEPMEDNGTFFMLDAYAFGKEKGLCTPRSTEISRAMRAIFEWRDTDESGNDLWPSTILAVRPFNIDPRIAAQRGCFTFHPPNQPLMQPRAVSALIDSPPWRRGTVCDSDLGHTGGPHPCRDRCTSTFDPAFYQQSMAASRAVRRRPTSA